MGCVGIHHTEITGLYTAEQDINQLAIGIHHPEITGFYTIKRLQEAQRREKSDLQW